MNNEINFNVRIAGQLKDDISRACKALHDVHESLDLIQVSIENEMEKIEHQVSLLKDYWPLYHGVPDYLKTSVEAKEIK